MPWPFSQRFAVAVMAVTVFTAGAVPTSAAVRTSAVEPTTSPATRAIDYIGGTQAADGGFFADGQAAATSGGLADTLVATAVDSGLSNEATAAALDRLSEIGRSATTRPAYTARIVMAIVASGADPTDFGGVDYAARLTEARSPLGWWETQNYANALAALGWAALDLPLPTESVLWIAANQCTDGGWGHFLACASTSDVDTTALTINALVAGGVASDDPAVVRARQFLVGALNDQGGFGGRPETETNANSTGLALSAIAALGEDPRDSPWSRGAGSDPLTQLLALQTAEGGFLWKSGIASMIDNYATVQAIPGVAGTAYPVRHSDNDACAQRRGRGVACPPRRR